MLAPNVYKSEYQLIYRHCNSVNQNSYWKPILVSKNQKKTPLNTERGETEREENQQNRNIEICKPLMDEQVNSNSKQSQIQNHIKQVKYEHWQDQFDQREAVKSRNVKMWNHFVKMAVELGNVKMWNQHQNGYGTSSIINEVWRESNHRRGKCCPSSWKLLCSLAGTKSFPLVLEYG